MFRSVRETAKLGLAPESFIRRLIAQGKCPGIYSGKKFLVHVEQLRAYLDAASRPESH